MSSNSPTQDRPYVSIIVPFYNEEDNIERVHQAIARSLEASGLSFEMVFVDDGSQDETFFKADALAKIDRRITVVKFRRNYGQTPAMAAGIQVAAGEILVTMDGDLQNDPADIPIFLEKIKEGNDIVVGWRHDRKDKLFSRKIPSRIANWLIGRVTGVPIRDNGCSLKAYRSGLIKAIPLYSEMHRFIPAMASIAGPRIAEVKVRHHARLYGKSKYGLSRVYKVLLDLMVIKTVTRFIAQPLVWFALISIPTMASGLIAVLYSVWQWAYVTGTLPIPIAGAGLIFLASSIMLLINGVLAELVYLLGDSRQHQFASLTHTSHSGPQP